MRTLDIQYKNNPKMKLVSLHTNDNVRPNFYFGFGMIQVHKYRQ